MNHAVILAHPKPDSFCAALAGSYAAAARNLGHHVLVRDLYAMDFDPRLKASEIPCETGYACETDVAAERAALRDVDVFTFVYPFWFNGPPAILKGYVDRVFSMGFGYDSALAEMVPRLTGRKLFSITTSGAPDHWVRQTGALRTLVAQLDRHLAEVTGMAVADHLHFGGIVGELTQEDADEIFEHVRTAVRRIGGGKARGRGRSLETRAGAAC